MLFHTPFEIRDQFPYNFLVTLSTNYSLVIRLLYFFLCDYIIYWFDTVAKKKIQDPLVFTEPIIFSLTRCRIE